MIDFLNKPLIYINETSFVALKHILLLLLMSFSAWLLSRFISKYIIGRILYKTKISKDSIAIFQKVIFFTILIIITFLVLSFFKISLTNLALLSSGITIAVGFAAKTIIENFLSGWVLMTERPIRIGDVIEFDDKYGTIIGIGNRATTIKRQDGAHMVIPNSQILESKLVNLTIIDPFVRTVIRVGVSYGTDVKLVKSLLMQVAEDSDLIIKEPKPLVIFEDFGDNALIFDLYFWASLNSDKQLREIRSDVRFTVSETFVQKNIVIAFPQRDVHLFVEDTVPQNLIKNIPDGK